MNQDMTHFLLGASDEFTFHSGSFNSSFLMGQEVRNEALGF